MDIAPDGDVVLVVGPQEVRLRVHSQCLSCASKVFSAMFRSDWSESQGLSRESPKEVQLGEDDAAAIRTICCVVHHRNNAVPQVIPPSELLQIAIAADKYDFGVALKYATAQWLQHKDSMDKTRMGYLMAAAYLFGDMEMFRKSTLSLILNYEGSYLELLENEMINQIIPCGTVYLLEERRNQMRAEVCELLIQGQSEACDCGWGANRKKEYKLIQINYRPLKMLEVPVSQIIAEMEAVSCEDMARKYHSETYRNYYHEAPTYSETLTGKLDAIKRRVGICIDCARGGADL